MSFGDLIEQMRRSSLFRRLPLGALDRLASQCRVVAYRPGETLMEEGAAGDALYLVLDGRVLVRKRTAAGEMQVIAIRDVGDWVGEMALLDDHPRSAEVAADGDVQALSIPRSSFLEVMTGHPEASLELIRTLTARLRESDKNLITSLKAKNRDLSRTNVQLSSENRRLRTELDERFGFENFIGSSARARALRTAGQRAAENDLPVLLLGETGTGKELIARSIHLASERASRSFVAVNCAALTETLLESELFGHTRGAFTGATGPKQGLVEAAHGGTLFLDEIADMPLPLQGALLRFLELGEFRRLGEIAPRHANVRVIAATHGDLEDSVRNGRFRADLYYRLDVIRIVIPPLRARSEDIPELVAHLVAWVAARADAAPLRVSDEAIEVLASYAFPGNVRELVNEIERLYAMVGPDTVVMPEHLSARVRGTGARRAALAGAAGEGGALGAPELCLANGEPEPVASYSEAVRRFKMKLVRRALEEASGNRARAARRLGVHRSNLVRMIRELGIES